MRSHALIDTVAYMYAFEINIDKKILYTCIINR